MMHEVDYFQPTKFRRLFRLAKIISLKDMLRSAIEEECPFNYLACLTTMGLLDNLRKLFGSSLPDSAKEEALTHTAIEKNIVNELPRGDLRKLSSEELSLLHKLYVDKVKARARSYSWMKKPTSSNFLFRNERDTKEDYEILSLSLNLLVLKSTKKVVLKDLHFFTDKYNFVEVERATKFLQGIKKKMDEGSQEDKRELFNAAVQNLHLYSLSRNKMSNCCDKLKVSGDRALRRKFQATKFHSHYDVSAVTRASFFRTMGLPGTSMQNALDALKRYSASCVAPCQIKFPFDSLLAVVEADASLKVNLKKIQKNLFTRVNQLEKIKYSKNLLQRVSRNGEEGPVTGLYVKAVEDLNLYCLANEIDLDVNKTFNIEAPTKNDIITFITDHQVRLENENLIRAFLSTAGHPNSNRHAIAAAMRQSPNNFVKNLVDRQVYVDQFEADLIKAISLYVIRNQLYSNIDLALVANKQRIKDFLDSNRVTIPYMAERNVLNLLGLVGRYEDESIVHASRLPIPKWATIQAPIKCLFLDGRKLYHKGVYNLFLAWQEINNRLNSERPKERIFCSEFISKLVEQSAGKYSEALVKGIQNFCAVHEFDAYPDFLQPFFKENNHLCEFLDSNWDKLLSNINIFGSLSVLATAGMPGTIVNDIVNIINSHELRGFRKCHSNFEAVNLSKQLLIVAAATNQIDKLTVLKDPKGQDYVPTFESLLREILSSEKLTDTALSKSEKISKAIRELKTYLFARSLKLPAFEELESSINSMTANEFTGQPDPLRFLDLFGESKNENNSDKFKRLADLPQIPLDNYPPSGIFDYLVATYRLVYSMKKAKVPLSMFKDANFPDLRYRDPKKILEYDELIDKDEVSKADKILGQIYSMVKSDDDTAPEWFVEAAEAVNLLSLSNWGSPINNWRGLEIADETVEDFKRGANLPERIAKDDELIRKFLVTSGLSKSGLLKKSRIIKAMQVRQEWSDFKDRIKAMIENDDEHSSIWSTDDQSLTENINQCSTQNLSTGL